MIEIDNKERYILKKFFNSGGWVLDFTTSYFDSFTYQSIGIKLCEKYRLSKGKSLEKFIDESKTQIIIRLMTDLIEHYEIIREDLPAYMIKSEQYTKVTEIIERYNFLSSKIGEDEFVENLVQRKKYDVFVSHATTDKLVAVNDIEKELSAIGAEVWYDSDSINWGDSLSEKIDEGLINCEFGMVILSRNFFDKPWCEKELHKLADRNRSEKQKVLLPLLLNISINEATEKYSFLEDIKMIEYTKGNEKDVALLFAKALIKRLKGVY